MRQVMMLSASVGLAGVLLMLAGCGKPPTTGGSSPPAGQAEQTGSPQGVMGGDAQIQQGLAELSPEDRAMAEKQKVCPVSGQALGSMGKPVKVHVKGRDVFLCCPDCEESIRKEPDKYLAKLPPAG